MMKNKINIRKWKTNKIKKYNNMKINNKNIKIRFKDYNKIMNSIYVLMNLNTKS